MAEEHLPAHYNLQISQPEAGLRVYELADSLDGKVFGALACTGFFDRNAVASSDNQAWGFEVRRHKLIYRDVTVTIPDSDTPLVNSNLNVTNGCTVRLAKDAYRLDILSGTAPHRAWVDIDTDKRIITYDMSSFTELRGDVHILRDTDTFPDDWLLSLLGLYLIAQNQRRLEPWQPPMGYPSVKRLESK